MSKTMLQTILSLLEATGISASHGRTKNEGFPRFVTTFISATPVSLSSRVHGSRLNYQIQLFSQKHEEIGYSKVLVDVLQSLEHEGFHIANDWDELVDSGFYVYTLEVFKNVGYK